MLGISKFRKKENPARINCVKILAATAQTLPMVIGPPDVAERGKYTVCLHVWAPFLENIYTRFVKLISRTSHGPEQI
jgi:hypothetical protein